MRLSTSPCCWRGPTWSSAAEDDPNTPDINEATQGTGTLYFPNATIELGGDGTMYYNGLIADKVVVYGTGHKHVTGGWDSDEGTDNVYIVDDSGERHVNVAGQVGFRFFGELILDCLNRTEKAMTQAHAFKAAELCLRAQLAAHVVHPHAARHRPQRHVGAVRHGHGVVHRASNRAGVVTGLGGVAGAGN